MGPLLTAKVQEQLCAAVREDRSLVECSLDLDRTIARVEVDDGGWSCNGRRYPHLQSCKERTIYYWSGDAFLPVSRYSSSLIKLVPTEWGAPTFEIDGVKMLPTAQISPYEDAMRKVALVQPRGKTILDTCGGLGYFADCCLKADAAQIRSYEKNPDVIWLRTLNPWSPPTGADDRCTLIEGDVLEYIAALPDASFDAALHDPPRFGLAGELYSQAFYDHLARLLRRRGKLFHYTGTPNKLTSGRDVPNEVARRLQRAGFATELIGDGVLAAKRA